MSSLRLFRAFFKKQSAQFNSLKQFKAFFKQEQPDKTVVPVQERPIVPVQERPIVHSICFKNRCPKCNQILNPNVVTKENKNTGRPFANCRDCGRTWWLDTGKCQFYKDEPSLAPAA